MERDGKVLNAPSSIETEYAPEDFGQFSLSSNATIIGM